MKNEQNYRLFFGLFRYDLSRLVSGEVLLEDTFPHWMILTGSLKIRRVILDYLKMSGQNLELIKDFLDTEQVPILSLVNINVQALLDELYERINLSARDIADEIHLLETLQMINQHKLQTYANCGYMAEILELEAAAKLFVTLEANEQMIALSLRTAITEQFTLLASGSDNVTAKHFIHKSPLYALR
jgi:hypothetical protein